MTPKDSAAPPRPPLRILIVSQYFWPESFRINDLAASLRARGHAVDVLTGLPNYPHGRFFDGYGATGPLRDAYDGIPVRRVPIVARGSARGWRLALNYSSFVLSAGLLGPFVTPRAVDVLFVFAPSPPTVALPALWLGALRRRPVVFWVQDLWPEALTAVDAVRSRFALRAVGRLVSAIYRRCDLVLGQSEAAVSAIRARGAEASRVRYFPCSAEDIYLTEAVASDATSNANGNSAAGSAAGARLFETFGVPPGFRVLFAGNVGVAQDLGGLLDAAERLRARTDIQWVILGDGRRRAWVASEVERRGLHATVHLIDQHPLSAMPAFFAAADALLVTLKRAPGFAETIPSKIQAYLASGRPIVAALDGEGARIVRDAGAGMACPAADPAALATAVADLANRTEEERAAMGRNGRLYYDRHFDRERLVDQLEAWLHELRAPSPSSGSRAV
jgi:glycosyltransferase involved in cell wall biosynthesis